MSAAAVRAGAPVIGIHDGHNASVALVRDGRVEFALQEERITRIKNQGDAPENALAGALALVRHAAGGADDARIALNGHYMNYRQWQRETILDDYRRSSTFASRIRQPLKGTILDRAYQRGKAVVREERLSESGLSRERIEPVEHHLAHASAAYYTCPWPDERVLVLTCDGSGDRLSATVSLGERGHLTRVAQICEHDSIGRLYAMVTRHMGMAPLEHEYKVMGLAPYVANGAKAAAAAEWFRQLFEFTREPMIWRRQRGVPSMYSAGAFLDRLLAGHRFDLIAAGIQRFVEDWLAAWARNCIRETGICKLACSGGIFMNVKANLRLLEIPELEDLYIFPSCGDESNSIGAALQLAARMGQRHTGALGPIYYGESISDGEAEQALDAAGGGNHRVRFRAFYVNDIERKTAEALAAGRIVARAKGAMEFGARALGNRSILARADSTGAVRIINQMVKSRDFWMPFAPSVLAERAGEYYSKPKPVASPYMMFAFPSRPEKRAAFTAAQHPYDFTTRPQEVTAANNPDYYRLLKEYEARTGEGIVLNTSFNLHGEPMVYAATASRKVDELTSILIESASAVADPDSPKDISPLESQRLWERQAEQNLLARLEKGGLLSPPGPVEEVLNTVVNNLIVSSKLDIEAHCRVLLTTPFETFAVSHTIVISRGLIDVLPDEGSLALTLASELAHIALGHPTQTQFAFNNQTMLSDLELLQRFHFERPAEEMQAASEKAITMMRASPYSNLANAGLFLKALAARRAAMPRLLQASLGDQVADAAALARLASFAAAAPALEADKLDQIAALPLGSRVKLNPWTNQLALVKTRPLALLSAREKLPFEVTPFVLYLTRTEAVSAKK